MKIMGFFDFFTEVGKNSPGLKFPAQKFVRKLAHLFTPFSLFLLVFPHIDKAYFFTPKMFLRFTPKKSNVFFSPHARIFTHSFKVLS